MHLPKISPERPVVAFAGELVVDRILHTPHQPVRIGQTTIEDYQETLGGCAPSAALGAVSIGAPAVRLIGHRGQDEIGNVMAQLLEEKKVATGDMTVRGVTAFAHITQWPSNRAGRSFERQQMFYGKDARSLKPSDLLAGAAGGGEPSSLKGVGVLVLNGHHLYKPKTEDWVLELARQARHLNIGVVMDLSSASSLMDYARHHRQANSRKPLAEIAIDRITRLVAPHIVVMNEDEWRQIGGGDNRASELVNRVDATVVHRGSQPTLIFDRYGNQYNPVPVDPVLAVREIGAGDAFAGGLAGTWVQGETDLQKLVEAAGIAAARWVTSEGIDLTGQSLDAEPPTTDKQPSLA